MLIRKEKISSDTKYNIVFNLYFIGVFLYNITPSFYLIFRFSIYFIIFAPIVLANLLIVINKKLSCLILISGFSVLFGSFIYENFNNKLVIPDKILPITSIFDN